MVQYDLIAHGSSFHAHLYFVVPCLPRASNLQMVFFNWIIHISLYVCDVGGLSLCLWCGKSFSMSAMLKVRILWAWNIPEDQLCIVFAERFNGECCGCGIRSPHTCRTLVGLCRLMCYQKLSRTAVWLLVGLITAPKVSDNWLEFQNIGWSLVCSETILWILRSFSFIALASECLCGALSSWKT